MGESPKPFMKRITLSDTRPALTHKFNINGTKGYFTVGLHEDLPVELFITISKQGSTIGGFADAVARLTSISLQHGVPLEIICHKMRYLRFEPMGNTINSEIPEATSVVDYIFHWIEKQFNLKPK